MQIGDMKRTLHVDSYLRRGPKIVITTDASPYGIGGIISVDGMITGYFSDKVTDPDRRILSLAPGCSSKNQQVLEALCMLVALRIWSEFWLKGRVMLTVRSDNLSTLALVAKMQPHSPQMGIIAREVALDVAVASYAPDIVEHLPGVANTVSDSLSRLHTPDKSYSVPDCLRDVVQESVPIRAEGWYKALSAALEWPAGTISNPSSVSKVQY